MRNQRRQSSSAHGHLHGVGWPLGALLATSLWPLAAAQAAVPKVKYAYQPVQPGKCAPCPCKCPAGAVSGPGLRPTPDAAPTAPVTHDASARQFPPLRTATVQSEPSAPWSAAIPATGSLSGTITWRDNRGQEQTDRSGVVVYIAELPGKQYTPLKKVRELTQRDKSFVPKAVTVTRGSVVSFPNADKFSHNVFSLSPANTFDLGLQRPGEAKSVTFEKVGVVDVYCTIHPSMWAQILVLDNPFFTTTEKDGRFALDKLPPGTFTVMARTLSNDAVSQQITIEPGKRAEIFLSLGLNTK